MKLHINGRKLLIIIFTSKIRLIFKIKEYHDSLGKCNRITNTIIKILNKNKMILF